MQGIRNITCDDVIYVKYTIKNDVMRSLRYNTISTSAALCTAEQSAPPTTFGPTQV